MISVQSNRGRHTGDQLRSDQHCCLASPSPSPSLFSPHFSLPLPLKSRPGRVPPRADPRVSSRRRMEFTGARDPRRSSPGSVPPSPSLPTSGQIRCLGARSTHYRRQPGPSPPPAVVPSPESVGRRRVVPPLLPARSFVDRTPRPSTTPLHRPARPCPLGRLHRPGLSPAR